MSASNCRLELLCGSMLLTTGVALQTVYYRHVVVLVVVVVVMVVVVGGAEAVAYCFACYAM